MTQSCWLEEPTSHGSTSNIEADPELCIKAFLFLQLPVVYTLL